MFLIGFLVGVEIRDGALPGLRPGSVCLLPMQDHGSTKPFWELDHDRCLDVVSLVGPVLSLELPLGLWRSVFPSCQVLGSL